ncbi:hypothetical protein CAPN008_16720 [Capnocytophaga canis]|uniref:hypothetical protein n=1 Tax=Capnocytophaga canis TaxID=1848903 RepID=UPI001ACD36F3|nr:hypothetical protein [Capnocytophaga canis]GIM61622.1 hypothetical protein CAPN008_16720 [Capnocytophaga canis]
MKKIVRIATATLFMFAITNVQATTLGEEVNVSIEKTTQDQDGVKQDKEKKSCCKSGKSKDKESSSKEKKSCSSKEKKSCSSKEKKSCCKSGAAKDKESCSKEKEVK